MLVHLGEFLDGFLSDKKWFQKAFLVSPNAELPKSRLQWPREFPESDGGEWEEVVLSCKAVNVIAADVEDVKFQLYPQIIQYDDVRELGEARERLNAVIKSKGTDAKVMRKRHAALLAYVVALGKAKRPS